MGTAKVSDNMISKFKLNIVKTEGDTLPSSRPSRSGLKLSPQVTNS